MVNQRVNKEEKSGRILFPVRKILIALVFVVLISVIIFFFYPQFFCSLAFKASRIKNTFSHYVLHERPHFYYLEVEKNGNDIRVGKDEALEVTYRDEFVVKSVVSDDLTGKYTTVSVEGLSKLKAEMKLIIPALCPLTKLS